MSLKFTDENPNRNDLLNKIEQHYRQLLAESKSNEVIIRTMQENLNKCLKHNIFLEYELETERFNKSRIRMELDTLTTMMNKYNKIDKSNSEFDTKVLIHDRQNLINKMCKIQAENVELKQELSKCNSKISLFMENQYIYPEKINSMDAMLNSLQIQIQYLKKESQLIVNILQSSKILGIKMLSALEYTKKLNKTQFDQIYPLIKEVANIKSKIHMFIDKNEKQQMMNNYYKYTNLSNQPDSKIYKTMVDILEVENNALHNYFHQMLKTKKFDVFDKYVVK